MRHLFASRVAILRQTGVFTFGSPNLSWTKIDDICDPFLGVPGEMMCRIDIGYFRPGRDFPAPVNAGRAPDRVGLLVYSFTEAVKGADRIECIDGPITGTFEIRSIPEVAVGFSTAHHIEVPIVEAIPPKPSTFPAQPLEIGP